MTSSAKIAGFIDRLDLPALSRELEKRSSTEAVIEVLAALRGHTERLEEVLVGLTVESNVRRMPPPLELPDPLVDDLCSRSLFTDFSEDQLEALAAKLLDVQKPAYPTRVSPKGLVTLMLDMTAREFGAAIVRDMAIAELEARGEPIGPRSARDLVLLELRGLLLASKDGEVVEALLALLDGVQGAFAALAILAVVETDAEGPLSLKSVRETLHAALASDGRMKGE
jgi:hypothetical protein